MPKKGKSMRRRVQEVIDGDTFRVRNRVSGSQYIRIAGLNAPERGRKGFSQAKRWLKRLIGGKTVTLRPVGKSHGRTVAKVIHKRRNIARIARKR